MLFGLVVVALSSCTRPAQKPAAVDAGPRSDGLAALIREELDAEFRFSPTHATWLGDHSADERLDDVSQDALWRENVRLANLLERTRRFADGLKPPVPDRIEQIVLTDVRVRDAQQLDTMLLLARLESLRIEREELRPHEKNPLFYSGIVAWGIDELLSNNLATTGGLRALKGRLQLTPSVLKEAQRNLRNPPELWVKRALEVTQQTRDFVGTILPRLLSVLRRPEQKPSEDVSPSREEALRALDEFMNFLNRDLLPRSKGDWSLSRDRLTQRLRALELLDVPVETVLAVAENEHGKTKQAFEDLSRSLGEMQSVARAQTEAFRIIEEDHPKPEDLTATVQQMAKEVFALFSDGSVFAPLAVRPRVVDMPPYRFGYLRLAAAAPLEPDRDPQLQLDPIDPHWKDKKQIAEHLRMLNRSHLRLLLFRELLPGRFLHQHTLRQKQAALSPLRSQGHSLALAEGWPLYATQLGIESLPTAISRDRLQLLQVKQRLLALGRLVVALRLHQNGNGGSTPNQRLDDATRFFTEECYADEFFARREAERGTFDPLYGLPALGLLQLEQLQADYQAEQGDDYSQRSFHDAVLSAGLVPITVLRHVMLKNPGSSLRAPALKTPGTVK